MKRIDDLTKSERELILARREYKRRWRLANPDKVKAANERFYKRLAEKLAEEKQYDEQADGRRKT